MGVEEGSIKPTSRPLTGFTAEHVYSCGTVRLPVYVGGISKLLKFIVMDKPAIYNAILGTPWLHEMKAVISIYQSGLSHRRSSPLTHPRRITTASHAGESHSSNRRIKILLRNLAVSPIRQDLNIPFSRFRCSFQATTISDHGEKTCPLCAEEMDLTDQQLKPCQCGYQMCLVLASHSGHGREISNRRAWSSLSHSI
ncbi:unnamed protein product [Microthlaspi erraticum]|uniref:Uncharacterized protein n=1 Tax=Microthlaspi erraticum TaxID=1685480 RepID=A0A6D2IXV1_9BRAS|nr:unnamed protein product [Microthlaspi erraticum]